MLYTKKGDGGSSKIFSSKSGERIPKSAVIFEALGTLDELNSFIGLARAKAGEHDYKIGENTLSGIALRVQQDLFIIQAEIAGAEKTLGQEKVGWLESLTDAIERELPEIKVFFIPGATELGALFDVARTVSRRVERTIVKLDESEKKLNANTLAYMNRLSSLLYALARLSNHISGITEESPSYT